MSGGLKPGDTDLSTLPLTGARAQTHSLELSVRGKQGTGSRGRQAAEADGGGGWREKGEGQVGGEGSKEEEKERGRGRRNGIPEGSVFPPPCPKFSPLTLKPPSLYGPHPLRSCRPPSCTRSVVPVSFSASVSPVSTHLLTTLGLPS